jgi:hypothetical protein
MAGSVLVYCKKLGPFAVRSIAQKPHGPKLSEFAVTYYHWAVYACQVQVRTLIVYEP